MNQAPPLPTRLETARADGRLVLRLVGPLTVHTTAPLWDTVAGLDAQDVSVEIDLAEVPSCDTAGAALIVHLRDHLGARERPVLVGAGRQVRSILSVVDRPAPASRPTLSPRPGRGIVVAVGDFAAHVLHDVRGTVEYIGSIARGLGRVVARPHSLRWGDTIGYMSQAGANALGIVALISFLMGVILAFQMAAQLSKYGADIYVADVVALSITRELGPLMTAIVVAGRSGSAFAAEIGTMKVNEEVAALDTMGLERTRFLVMPKVIALLLMMPLLVMFANVAGVVGGMLIGTTFLDLPIAVYARQTVETFERPLWDVGQGLIKGETYAVIVAAVGCLRGLQTREGAHGVGVSATSAVVSGIFLIIIADAALTVLFHYVQ